MTQVSKRMLAKQMEKKVYETFWETIAKLNKKWKHWKTFGSCDKQQKNALAGLFAEVRGEQEL